LEKRYKQLSRKEQIIEAALKIFTVKGFTADFTMSSLAKNLDIGKSTIYEYFDNKDDIIKAAIMKYLDDRFEVVNTLFQVEAVSFEEAFKQQLKTLLCVASESRTLIETLSPGFFKKLPDSVQAEVKARMEAARNSMQKGFEMIFTRAAKEGIISIELSQEKSMVVTAMVIGSIMLFSDSRTNLILDSFVDEIYLSALKVLN
jgi:AcrR family transcriptional regulator